MTSGDRARGGLPPAALLALLAGESNAEVAKLAGMSERTLRRRLADPGVKREIRDAREWQINGPVVGGLAGAAPKAVRALVELLDCGNETVRVAAARAILDGLLKYREHGDLSARLAEIEAALAGRDA